MNFKNYMNETLPQSKNIVIIDEEYALRAKSSIPKVGTVEVFKNPTIRDRKALGDIIRFTAYNKTQTVYAWAYDKAYHVDVSKAIGIKHTFNNPDLLTGAATWQNGSYVFTSSDFLKDFRRMAGEPFLNELLSNNWSWADKYIKITPTLDKLRNYISEI